MTEYLERLYKEYSEWVLKAQDYYKQKDRIMPKAFKVIPGVKHESIVITDELLKEYDRLDALYEEAEKKQREIMGKIAKLR